MLFLRGGAAAGAEGKPSGRDDEDDDEDEVADGPASFSGDVASSEAMTGAGAAAFALFCRDVDNLPSAWPLLQSDRLT